MAMCGICGKKADQLQSESLILNKLFFIKEIILCENLCEPCYSWVYDVLYVEMLQPFRNPVTTRLDKMYR